MIKIVTTIVIATETTRRPGRMPGRFVYAEISSSN